MLALFAVFVVTVISGLVAVTGGNGLILMPSLLMMNYDIKEVMVLIRVSAVVFVLFNLLALINGKQIPKFDKRDLTITIISCLSVLLSILLLTKLDNTSLMFIISIILIGLFLLVLFKPKGSYLTVCFVCTLPIFAGICGSAVGGAGLIISILYTLLGSSHIEAVQKRIIPSLIIQVLSFVTFMSQGINVSINLLIVVIIATAISGYLNMKIFLKLTPKNGKRLFYASFIFSIANLLEDAFENILEAKGLDWVNLVHM
jgi:uncharacterized membrane protein YfcA